MSRHDETIGRMPNPSQFFLEWNNEKQSFCYYSKDTEERIAFPLPFKFVALKFASTITGYDEVQKKGIYANEVIDTRYEHFRVAYRDGGIIGSGLYADIKDELKSAGGRFTKSIYAMTPKGVVVNIRIKGSAMISFGAIEKFGGRWKDEYIQVSQFETREHEGEPYTVPIFTFAGTLSPADAKKADDAYKLVKEYFNSKPAQASNARPAQQHPAATPAPQVPAAIAANDNDDDLPF